MRIGPDGVPLRFGEGLRSEKTKVRAKAEGIDPGKVRPFKGQRRPHRVLVGEGRKEAIAPELEVPMSMEQSQRLSRSRAKLEPLAPLEDRHAGSAVGKLVGAAHSGDPTTQKGLELVAQLLGPSVSDHPGVQRFMQLTRANSVRTDEENSGEGGRSEGAAEGKRPGSAAGGRLPPVLALD